MQENCAPEPERSGKDAALREDSAMRFRTTYAQTHDGTSVANAKKAVRKIASDLADFSPALVLYFAATDYDPHILAAEMHDAFPDAKTFGCTTAGEGVNGKILNSSVVAMAYSADVFEYCEMAVVLDDGQKPEGRDVFDSPDKAMRHLGRKLGQELIQLDYRKYVGFMLGDRISSFSESLLERIGELTDVIFIGGFAGDDYKFIDAQSVFYQGRVYQSAAVLALWKPRAGFALLKTQAADLTDRKMVITRADEKNRIIWEFDHEAAAPAYARAINTPVETMDILDFDGNPLAITAEGEPFLRAIVKQVDNKGLQMFARVREGTVQTLTKAGDVYAVTKTALEAKRKEMGGFSAVLHINCSSRHTALKNRDQVDAFAALFEGVPSIAFSSYGEIFVGAVALTSTMILFK